MLIIFVFLGGINRVTFSRAKTLASQYKISDILYPLFVNDPSVFLYSNAVPNTPRPASFGRHTPQRSVSSNTSITWQSNSSNENDQGKNNLLIRIAINYLIAIYSSYAQTRLINSTCFLNIGFDTGFQSSTQPQQQASVQTDILSSDNSYILDYSRNNHHQQFVTGIVPPSSSAFSTGQVPDYFAEEDDARYKFEKMWLLCNNIINCRTKKQKKERERSLRGGRMDELATSCARPLFTISQLPTEMKEATEPGKRILLKYGWMTHIQVPLYGMTLKWLDCGKINHPYSPATFSLLL